jgi:alkylation response protein AidB-like acyl-CoA dehydrogenase
MVRSSSSLRRLQLHDGPGPDYRRRLDRDVKIMDIWEGTGKVHRQTVSRHLFATSSGH